MIDQPEAQRIALRKINPPHGEGQFAITHIIEKPYGWIFCYQMRDGNAVGASPFVVERENGKVHGLYGSGVALGQALAWFEEELSWRQEYTIALDWMKVNQFGEAELKLQECLQKAEAIVAQRNDGLAEWLARAELILPCLRSIAEVQWRSGNASLAEQTLLHAKGKLDEWAPLERSAAIEQRVPLLEFLMTLKVKQFKFAHADLLKREIGIAYRTAKDYARSQEILEQQLQKRSEIYPAGHPAVAQSLTDLSTLKGDLNQFFEAKIFLDAAMDIWDPLLKDIAKLKAYAEQNSLFTATDFLEMAAETMHCYAQLVLVPRNENDQATAMRQRAKELLASP